MSLESKGVQQSKRVSLCDHHTFGLQAEAWDVLPFDSLARYRELNIELGEARTLILGEGSNVVFLENFDGYVLKNAIKLREIHRSQSTEEIELCLGAGESWHEVVMWSLENGIQGLENLVLIPGSVGAAPIQNIGAYGRELKDVVSTVKVWDHDQEKILTLAKGECEFGYRESLFKRANGRYLILEVTLRLKQNQPLLLSYGDIAAQLKLKSIDVPTPLQLAEAIIAIRRSKLPDPEDLGNAGSFFKNPILSVEASEVFIRSHPEAKVFPLPSGGVKVAAGWLIDDLGWKGRRVGGVGVHDRQALVLVNHGHAKGSELLSLVGQLQEDVWNFFGIHLIPEVNFIGNMGRRLG
jgi:UDP-N-acetylmuramate dehydrogenase